MRRREFLTLVGGVMTAWPLALRAQQQAMPVIGLLSSLRESERAPVMAAFLPGLTEAGYVEGQNVAIEYRWGEGKYERLPALAADLVARQVTMIATISGTPTALAAKAATTTIPIVFAMGADPVAVGLVSNLGRPGGNVTGATYFTSVVAAKRVGMLHELTSKTSPMALLVNPNNPPNVEEGETAQHAAREMGREARIFNASTASQIDDAFTAIVQNGSRALYVSSDPLFFNQRDKIVALAAKHALPAIFADREIVEAGGLVSYGASREHVYRQAGSYAGRILKGEKPGDLPVMLPTKFDLVVNLKTAKALSLEFPSDILSVADQVIE
ncbi:MAG TPA: ABC transporter substrate-binding protein [Xanthobacteraceae bacterium]